MIARARAATVRTINELLLAACDGRHDRPNHSMSRASGATIQPAGSTDWIIASTTREMHAPAAHEQRTGRDSLSSRKKVNQLYTHREVRRATRLPRCVMPPDWELHQP